MKLISIRLFLLLSLLNPVIFFSGICQAQTSPRKIYMSYILHGNMNYDRYVKSTIWRDFPIIYDNLLCFMEEHPDFKGQVQFSGQTFKSLQQTAPHVIAHAMRLHQNGQINFTGTFYSEPVNVNMDGETNYRCARLGTAILSDATGSTDGFYLQERAYHPQLPWILNHSGVSWVPVITGDDIYFPFELKGMDGSYTTCVPIFSRDNILEKVEEAPANSLLLIEEDYEIPQSFSKTYQKIQAFNKEHKNVEITWITVKEYIKRFGTKGERYVDHTAKATERNKGTYSRWTADPLDILVQDYTNRAMSDFRAATMVNSLMQYVFQRKADEVFSNSKIMLEEDPLTWNIEHAGDYPDIEPSFLSHDGKVTLLSKAEHLLLWAVNSDAKGWYPLYERRMERINSFKNSSALSREIIDRGLDAISGQIKAEGYDRYFIVFNPRPERTAMMEIKTDRPYDVYDYGKGKKLPGTVSVGSTCQIDFESTLPAYGYQVIALKQTKDFSTYAWFAGASVTNGKQTLTAVEDKIMIGSNGNNIVLSLDSFKIKALDEMTSGSGDAVWRDAIPYGKVRRTTRKALYPQLRIERQLDWLVHLQQTFTLLPDRVICDMDFHFSHPTLVRKSGSSKGNTFDPEGLTLMFKTGKPGKVFYDMPFGISPHMMTGLSYFCPLSTGMFQYDTGGGFMVTAGTGEQAFYSNAQKGEMGIYMGASTTSGPIRDVGMRFMDSTTVDHESAWYAEPFHGIYSHRLMIYPFSGSWQEQHAPEIAKNYTQGVILREFYASSGSGTLPAEQSLVSVDCSGIEITSMDCSEKGLSVRLNEIEGKASGVKIVIGNETRQVAMPANGIVDVHF